MAAGFLRSFDPTLDVLSAGTRPAGRVHPVAVAVMKEVGIDLSGARPGDVAHLISGSFDYVITVCDRANETCPVFSGRVSHRLHMGFDDPAIAVGEPDEILAEFRRVRDEIRAAFLAFYASDLRQ
jgi:arsenate reductase (thioredoxin)